VSACINPSAIIGNKIRIAKNNGNRKKKQENAATTIPANSPVHLAHIGNGFPL